MGPIRKILVIFTTTLCGFLGPAAQAADPIVEMLFWGEISDAAGKGVQNYQKLHGELGLMRSEIARLSEELKNCNGCDRQRIEAELETWQGTYGTFQSFTGSVLSQMGYDTNVMRFFGVDNPAGFQGPLATGQKDYIDFDALPDPDWLATAGPMCKRIYDEYISCSKAWQDAGRPRVDTCKEIGRLNMHCGKGEVEKAEEYMTILSLRRAGIRIPEVTYEAGRLVVDYGKAHPGVDPQVPLGWQMYDYLMADRLRESVSYNLERGGAGLLVRAYYTRFRPSDLRPFRDNCMRSGVETPRYCKALLAYRHSYKEGGYLGAPVLVCDYGRSKPGSVDRVEFWLYRKPSFAGLVASVDNKGGKMTIGNFCPRRYGDAKKMQTGSLDAERLAMIDYSADARGFADLHDLPSETTYTPDTAATRITGYLDGIEAASLSAEDFENEALRRQNSGSKESAPEKENQDAEHLAALSKESADTAEAEEEHSVSGKPRNRGAARNIDIIGLEVGLSREEVLGRLNEAIGVIQVSVEVSYSSNSMFQHNLHLVSEDGSLLILGFDGPGEDAILMGALRITAAEKTTELVDALLRKYRPWGSEVDGDISDMDELYGVFAGDKKCTVRRVSQSSIVEGMENFVSDLPNAAITKSVLQVQYHELLAKSWATCAPAMLTQFYDDYLVTTVVDMDLVSRSYLAAKAGEPKPKTPEL